MSGKRKSLSKKLRFDVFKRDCFACQYCGRSAPDVTLHVDHITPVAEGGKNEITNLISSCVECNLGKGATPLSDDTTVSKQRKQMQELQERRELIEMMAQWKRELDTMRDEEVRQAADYFQELSGCYLNEHGLRGLRSDVRRFGFAEVLEAISIACEKYLRHDSDGNVERGSVEAAFKKIGGICYVRASNATTPWLSDFYKLRAIGRSAFGYWKDHIGCQLLRDALSAGHDVNTLRCIMNESRSWSGWYESMTDLMGSHGQ